MGADVMDRSTGVPGAMVAAVPQPRAQQMRPTRGPPAGGGWAAAGSGAGAARGLVAERDRIAQRLNSIVVHRLFAAGLELQAALGLAGDGPGAGRIVLAIGELDQAITDLRDAIFDHVPVAAHPDRSHG
jgi:signal transduction histidine kinase